jgi:alpha-glucosidase
MQWTAEKNAGFSTKEPWLPVAKGYRKTNVAAQKDDPDSLLNFYKRLLAVRNREPALQTSLYRPIAAPENLWVFQREKEGDRFLIAANFDSRKKHEFDVSNFIPNPVGEIVLSTLRRNEGEPFDRTLKLAKEEGVLIRLKPA